MMETIFPPEGLLYFPIVEHLMECRMEIERPEYRYNRHGFSPNLIPERLPEIQYPHITLELEVALYKSIPTTLTDCGSDMNNLFYFKIIHLQNISFITALLESYNSEDLGAGIKTNVRYRGQITRQMETTSNTIEILLGSLTPDPIWMQQYYEGQVNIEIQLNKGSILL